MNKFVQEYYLNKKKTQKRDKYCFEILKYNIKKLKFPREQKSRCDKNLNSITLGDKSNYFSYMKLKI